MTPDTEALRAQFEAWFADGYPRAVERDVHGQYKLMAAQSSWVAFQAGHAAAKSEVAEVGEPVAWLFQHEETGHTKCVDAQQVEWGFERNNPRWQKIGPLYGGDTIDALREALIKCKQQASIMRIWNGMGWTYHPPQAKRIYEAAEAALAATRTGEQHDNFCT